MPQAPDFSNIANTWRHDTKLTFSTGRSNELKNLETWLNNYQASKTPQNLEELKEAMDTWLGLKVGNNGQINTRRDHSGAVTALKQAVNNAVQLQTPVQWSGGYPGIYIAHDLYRGAFWVPDEFTGAISDALDKIASKPVGANLLRALSQAYTAKGKSTVIQYTKVFSSAAPVPDKTNETRAKIQPTLLRTERLDSGALLSRPELVTIQAGPIWVPGGGMSTVVLFKHDDLGPPGRHRPPFVGLAHELVHAYHYTMGACYRNPTGGLQDQGNTGLMEEEMRTVGLGHYANETPSENAIRTEHSITLRTSYNPGEDWTQVTFSGPATVLRRDRTDLDGIRPKLRRKNTF
jgi:hypothetical protein